MTFSTEWDQLYKDNTHLSIWPWSDIVCLSMRHCRQGFKEGYRVLELGCGAGANIPFFDKLGLDFYGIEGSPAIVEKIHENYPHLKDQIKVGDFTKKIPFKGKFDLIIDRASITCNSTGAIKDTLGLIKNALNPCGKFIAVDWYSVENSEYQLGEFSGDDKYTKVFVNEGGFQGTGEVHFFDENHIHDLLNGFKVEFLEHKAYRNHIPRGEGYQFCSWNFVASLD